MLKKLLSGFTKELNKQTNSLSKSSKKENLKFLTIDKSDEYFDLIDEAVNNEMNSYFGCDPLLLQDAYKKNAEKWIQVSEKMERISPPMGLPFEARDLFVQSHNLLIQSAKVKAQINVFSLKKLLVETEKDYDKEAEYKHQIDTLEQMYNDMQKSFRNAFDTVLYVIENN